MLSQNISLACQVKSGKRNYLRGRVIRVPADGILDFPVVGILEFPVMGILEVFDLSFLFF